MRALPQRARRRRRTARARGCPRSGGCGDRARSRPPGHRSRAGAACRQEVFSPGPCRPPCCPCHAHRRPRPLSASRPGSYRCREASRPRSSCSRGDLTVAIKRPVRGPVRRSPRPRGRMPMFFIASRRRTTGRDRRVLDVPTLHLTEVALVDGHRGQRLTFDDVPGRPRRHQAEGVEQRSSTTIGPVTRRTPATRIGRTSRPTLRRIRPGNGGVRGGRQGRVTVALQVDRSGQLALDWVRAARRTAGSRTGTSATAQATPTSRSRASSWRPAGVARSPCRSGSRPGPAGSRRHTTTLVAGLRRGPSCERRGEGRWGRGVPRPNAGEAPTSSASAGRRRARRARECAVRRPRRGRRYHAPLGRRRSYPVICKQQLGVLGQLATGGLHRVDEQGLVDAGRGGSARPPLAEADDLIAC